jgi:hypothetical protein
MLHVHPCFSIWNIDILVDSVEEKRDVAKKGRKGLYILPPTPHLISTYPASNRTTLERGSEAHVTHCAGCYKANRTRVALQYVGT